MTGQDETPTGHFVPVTGDTEGLGYLERMRDGKITPPPMAGLIGAHAVSAERGLVEFAAIPTAQHLNSVGTIHGGFVCTLLDTASGGAALSVMDAEHRFASLDLDVRYLRPVTIESGTITARARVIKTGGRVVFVDAEAHDAAGRLVATSTSSVFVVPLNTEASDRDQH